MVIVYAPDERARALALCFEAEPCLSVSEADDGALVGEGALLLVTSDYYSRGLWRMKRWLTERSAALAGKLCACLVRCAGGVGGELALRTLVSQLMEARCPVYLCAVAGSDGRIRPGGCPEPCGEGMGPPEYYTKLLQMAAKFG